MALLTTTFERINIPERNMGELNYFSPSTFAERHVTIKLEPLTESTVAPTKKSSIYNLSFGKREYHVQHLEQGGWLIRDCLDREEQIDFYRYTIDLSKNSSEYKEIIHAPKNKAYPITYYKLVYTGESNCPRPDRWFDWATKIWNMLIENSQSIDFPEFKEEYVFDSLYGQLFGNESKMNLHRDEHVTWGVSVSLGASCDFVFGNETIMLNSGDVLIADFSKIDHGVPHIHTNTVPGWFSDDTKQVDNGLESFGRIRCSIQIRNVSNCVKKNMMTTEQFKAMLASY